MFQQVRQTQRRGVAVNQRPHQSVAGAMEQFGGTPAQTNPTGESKGGPNHGCLIQARACGTGKATAEGHSHGRQFRPGPQQPGSERCVRTGRWIEIGIHGWASGD